MTNLDAPKRPLCNFPGPNTQNDDFLIVFQTIDLIGAMQKDGATFSELRVDGGMVSNNWFSQQLADALNLSVLRPKEIETTALGAAYLASIQANINPDLESLKKLWVCEIRFIPQKENIENLKNKYNIWLSAVKRTKGLFS